jgi:hypothetical protein
MTTKLTTRQRDKLIEAAQNAIEITVQGTHNFPYDMLRYDLCWPASEQDSYIIGLSHAENASKSERPFRIHLKGLKLPTVARWNSFGWEAAAS